MELMLQFKNFMDNTVSSIEKQEEEMMKSSAGFKLSKSEIHLIETVGRYNGGVNVSDIAADLNVSCSTVTMGVGRLVKKGFLLKQRDKSDARSTIVTLTPDGVKADELHRAFHMKVADSLKGALDEEEVSTFVKAMSKLNQFSFVNKKWRQR